jgi:hypothetical protein
MKRPLLLLALCAPALAHAQAAYQQTSPYTVVETGQKFNRLQDALFAIGDKTGDPHRCRPLARLRGPDRR